MNDDWFIPLWMQVTILLAVIAGLAVFVRPRIAQHMKGSGGWGALAKRYPAPPNGAQPQLRRQTVKVGQVMWRNCVSVGIDDRGLRLDISAPLPFLAKPSLLLPWSAVAAVEPVRLQWQEAFMLTIGQPSVATVTLPAEIYARVASRLSAPRGVA